MSPQRQKLLNRLSQPIPEWCPVSEAVCWVLTGSLPISMDDYKSINSPSFYWQAKAENTFRALLTDDFYANSPTGTPIKINESAFELAANKLMLALKNKNIQAKGIFVPIDEAIENAEEKHPISNPHVIKSWQSFAEKNSKILSDSEASTFIPSELWSAELVDWFDNSMHPPMSEQMQMQFCDITVSTQALFAKFDENEIIYEPTTEETKGIKQSDLRKVRSGRREKYDWNAFYTEIVVMADLDSLPETQADLERIMAEWCEKTWGEQPSLSTIRKRISPTYSHPRRFEKSRE